MPKKRRRKLDSQMEKDISLAKKQVELITAIINDIVDDEIRAEYSQAFNIVKNAYVSIAALYDLEGYNDSSVSALREFQISVEDFKNEYET